MAGNAYRERSFQCTLTVFEHLRKGLSPSLLWKQDVLKERQVKHALKKLKAAGFIRKIGYGTWETTVPDISKELLERRYNRVHPVARQEGTLEKEGTLAKPDSDRMHAVQVTVRIPRLKNWDRRASVLENRKIPYTKIVQGQRIMFRDIKTWLCNGSIVMYLPFSWFADTSAQAVERATRDTWALIEGLEKRLGAASFKIKGKYHFRFSRQHHSLVKNALAQEYNWKGRKLRVYDEKGLWLIIDDSFNLEELEAVHPDTSPEDHRKVQAFFNSLKENPVTTHDITGIHSDIQEFKGMLQGFVQQGLASANAQMYAGAALKKQTEILERIEERTSRENVPKTGQISPQNGRFEDILNVLSVLAQDKIMKGEVKEAQGLEKYTETDKDVEVQFMEPIPRIIIPYRGALKTIGPFPQGARVYVPVQIARLMVEKQAARLTGESIA